MTLDEIKQLVDFIRDRELSEFELERADVKLRIKSGTVVQTVMAAPALSRLTLAPTRPGAAGAGAGNQSVNIAV